MSGESELTKNAFKILYATDEDHDQAEGERQEGGEVLDGDQAQVRVCVWIWGRCTIRAHLDVIADTAVDSLAAVEQARWTVFLYLG